MGSQVLEQLNRTVLNQDRMIEQLNETVEELKEAVISANNNKNNNNNNQNQNVIIDSPAPVEMAAQRPPSSSQNQIIEREPGNNKNNLLNQQIERQNETLEKLAGAISDLNKKQDYLD